MPEAARVFIDAQLALGKTREEIRTDEIEFQAAVLRMKEKLEDKTPTNELILWDRGLHGDSAAYFAWTLTSAPPIFEDYSNTTSITKRYKGVFILDRLPFYQGDYARIEDNQQAAFIHALIDKMYRLLRYEPIRVPVMPGKDEEEQVNNRAAFVIAQMRKIDPSVPDLPLPPHK